MYEDHCRNYFLDFKENQSIISPDTSTLFTTSGMQKHKNTFLNPEKSETISDVQRCLRLNDLDEIGDGTHYLDFHMLGLFSFQNWNLQKGVDFWMEFCHKIGVIPDTVTIHPDCLEWKSLYDNYNVEIKLDEECIWSDGNIGGYCTEFYKDSIEIGNIVNPLGKHLDCGFGMERLEYFYSNSKTPSYEEILIRTITILIENDIKPSNTQHGYILRRLIRLGINYNLPTNPIIEQEKIRINKIRENIPKLLKKYPDKDIDFFWQTFGINKEEFVFFKNK